MAVRWTYRNVFFRYDEATDHFMATIDGEAFSSVEKALNHLGAEGWELVSMTVEDQRTDPPHIYAAGLRAVLKRPVP